MRIFDVEPETTWSITARVGGDSHKRLCDAFLHDGGFLLVSDRLFEVLYSVAVDAETWRWELRSPVCAGRA